MKVTLVDDNWLGPKQSVYYFNFIVTWTPNATIYSEPADISSIGADIFDISLTGLI